jgi:hypothetical protein
LGKLDKEELHNLHFSPNVIRIIKTRRMGYNGNVKFTRKKDSYTVLLGRLEGKRPLGRSRRRLEDNIKMDLIEIGQVAMEWILLAQEAVP